MVIYFFTYGNNIDKCGFSRVLKSDQCQLHFFLPEEAFKPVQDSVDNGQHGDVDGRCRTLVYILRDLTDNNSEIYAQNTIRKAGIWDLFSPINKNF